MAFTQSDLDTIDRIIATGVMRGKINGEEVEYRSMAEVQAARRMIAAAVGGTGGPAIGVTYPRTGRGL